MKTYSESIGIKPINWNARLRRWKIFITKHKWLEWEEDASKWITCACGNQCYIIPRYLMGRPVDTILAHYGEIFMEDIEGRNIKSARKTLKLIEQRSAELIKQLKP